MARTSLLVQVKEATVQVHPVPAKAEGVSAEGSVSTTVTVPAVGAAPWLEAMMVYVAPCCPCLKSPTCDFAMVRSGAKTVMEAAAVVPAPPSTEFTAPVTLFCTPPAIPVTFTEKLQGALAANVAPVKVATFDPATAVIVPPPHVPVSPFGVDTARPAGSASLKPTPVSDVAVFGLLRVNVKEVDPLKAILAAP